MAEWFAGQLGQAHNPFNYLLDSTQMNFFSLKFGSVMGAGIEIQTLLFHSLPVKSFTGKFLIKVSTVAKGISSSDNHLLKVSLFA